MSEIIVPTDDANWKELRSRDVTSTEVSALFDCNPYLTKFELFHRKKNATIVNIDENERMKWGTRLQEAIAFGIAHDNGWQIRRMDEYIRIRELRMGASFDYSACHHKTDGLGTAIEGHETQDYILEVKNVDSLAFKDGWISSDDGIEAPPHIEIQVQVQLAVSGREIAYIGALVGGNKVILLKREANKSIIAAIKQKVVQFWEMVESGVEPGIDYSRDSGFISKLYGFATPGKVMDLSSDTDMLNKAKKYREFGEQIKALDIQRDEIKAEFLRRIGDSEKVIGGLYSISAGLVGPAHVEYDRAGYRSFKISWKKVK